MISFERTDDWALIKQIITDRRVYPHVSDDFSPTPEAYEPLQHESIWYILAKDDGFILGLWILIPDNFVCWKIHTCLLPGAWGHLGQEAAALLPNWIWSHTKCLRIITDVPEYNRLALKFAKQAGMEEFGVNERSYMKKGELQNLIMLGISKPVNLCQ
jgi:RimJ/RimL family protein N-acetyltransferase